MCQHTKLRHRQCGLALTETVIVLPVLLLLFLAAAELGRVLYQYNTLTKAVRDGARYLAANAKLGSTEIIDITDEEEADTKNLVVYGSPAGTGTPLLPGLTTGDVTVSSAGGDYVQVNASYVYSPMLGSTLPTFGFGEDIALSFTLQASVSMRAL